MHNDQSSVMGFAPLGCMPVTRRSPYVALAVYGGPKLNAHKRTPGDHIGFIDAPTVDASDLPLDADAHAMLWDSTMDRVKNLLGDPLEDDFRLKDVAFCLPAIDVADRLPVA